MISLQRRVALAENTARRQCETGNCSTDGLVRHVFSAGYRPAGP
jgi:hypothetical protein